MNACVPTKPCLQKFQFDLIWGFAFAFLPYLLLNMSEVLGFCILLYIPSPLLRHEGRCYYSSPYYGRRRTLLLLTVGRPTQPLFVQCLLPTTTPHPCLCVFFFLLPNYYVVSIRFCTLEAGRAEKTHVCILHTHTHHTLNMYCGLLMLCRLSAYYNLCSVIHLL